MKRTITFIVAVTIYIISTAIVISAIAAVCNLFLPVFDTVDSAPPCCCAIPVGVLLVCLCAAFFRSGDISEAEERAGLGRRS